MGMHLEKEIQRLKRRILSLCAIVEDSVRQAVHALHHSDCALAERVIETDATVDELEVEVEEECLKILALHQPVATDLRFIISVLKINNDLERIGDKACNIAKRCLFLADHGPVDVDFDFPTMARKTQEMLKKSLDSLVGLDPQLAREVCAADRDVDALHAEMVALVEEEMRNRPERIDGLMAYFQVSRHLERIADLATNIAEDVLYMTEGAIVRHKPAATQTLAETDEDADPEVAPNAAGGPSPSPD